MIAAAEQAENAVLIGASFISMEVASAFRERGLSISVVSQDSIPLLKLKQLGPQITADGVKCCWKNTWQKGIRFLPEAKVLAITGVAGIDPLR
jgi:pyruvate/2-oxoglutarate dehydrogenase complex dihydrolipoamide dehydrogenase (E3) component